MANTPYTRFARSNWRSRMYTPDACSAVQPRAAIAAPGSSCRHGTQIPVSAWSKTTSSSKLHSKEPAKGEIRLSTPGLVAASPARPVAATIATASSRREPNPRTSRNQKPGRSLRGTFQTAFRASWALRVIPRPAQQGNDDADDQGDAGALDGLDAATELGTQHRELGDGRVNDPLPQLRVVRERVPEHGGEHQHQGNTEKKP